MKSTCLVIGILIHLLLLASNGFAQIPTLGECERARDTYSALNERLILETGGEDFLDPKFMASGTEDLIHFITNVTLARLQDSGQQEAIQRYLSCMHEGIHEDLGADFTNTPQVAVTNDSTPLAVTSLLIMRGAAAVPNTRPLSQCFAKKNLRWVLVGQSGGEFDGRTFYVYPLQSPKREEAWYLLTGKRIGDSTTRLRIAVMSCSADSYHTVWERDDIERGVIEVSGGEITLNYDKRDERGRFFLEDATTGERKRFTEYLRVTEKGLEP